MLPNCLCLWISDDSKHLRTFGARAVHKVPMVLDRALLQRATPATVWAFHRRLSPAVVVVEAERILIRWSFRRPTRLGSSQKFALRYRAEKAKGDHDKQEAPSTGVPRKSDNHDSENARHIRVVS